MTKSRWDEANWAVNFEALASVTIQTQGGQTWAVRALIAAGAAGLRPLDTGSGRWAKMVADLRAKGMMIADLPVVQGSPPGFVLACTVEPQSGLLTAKAAQ